MIRAITASHSSSAMFWIDGTRTMLSTRMITASGRNISATEKRESTKSRTNLRTGPLSRAGR